MAKEPKKKRKILEAARKYQDELQAAGLHAEVLDRYENALKVTDAQGKEPSPAAQVLVRDLQREIGEVQAAIRKEFSGNTSFQSIFKANEPMPQSPPEVLALGRLTAREAPDFAQNLIKYAINAASVKHLTSLCDQLEREIGGEDPGQQLKNLEAQIVEAARRALEGKPELSSFTG